MNEITQVPRKKISGFNKIKFFSIPRGIRITSIVLLLVFLIAAGGYWYIVEFYQKYADEKTAAYSYTSDAALAYKVFYMQNPVVSEQSLGENQVYITAFVDYIDTAINYEFSGDKAADIKITYSVNAYLQGIISSLNEDKVLWSKTYDFLPQQTVSVNDTKATLSFKLPVRLNDITTYANQVQNSLDINSNLKLKVVYNILIEATTDKGTVNEAVAPSLVIPIADKYFEITKNSVDKKTGTIDESIKSVSPLYELKRLCCWILMALFTLALLFVFLFTKKLVLNPQQKIIDQLFKKHGSRIVVLNSDIKNGTKEIVEISTFDGLIRTADDLGKPVFYKDNGTGDEYCNFYVVDDRANYIYNPWHT